LLKPAGASDEAHHRLAPLLVHEARSAAESDSLPGRLVPGDAALQVDPQRPTVYWWSQRVTIAGMTREQLIYQWHYGGAGGWRWLRLTLDADGFPAIAEVLAPGARQMDVYISRSLEEAAAKAFGRPEGGSLAVSRQRAEGPARIVRVIDDGPVPMGPMVYLDFPDRGVTTLLCRCMPSQVEDVVESPYYELVPGDELAEHFAVIPESLFLPHGLIELPARAKDGPAASEWLERILRLPRDF
jgi:hypothetical protein